MKPVKSTFAIVQDWTKFTTKDFSDDILDNASRTFRLLESLTSSTHKKGGERIEVNFSYLLHGAFVDMGAGRLGYNTFKPRKWYNRNWFYSTNKLAEMMMSRNGRIGQVRMREIYPNIIKL